MLQKHLPEFQKIDIFAALNLHFNATSGLTKNLIKDPGPEDPALVIPGGDLVYCNLNGSRSDGVLE